MSKKNNQQQKQEIMLPYYKIGLEKQLDILKAYVAFYNKNNKPASYKDIAPIITTHPNNVSATIGFWKAIGLLERKDGGNVPTQVCIAFCSKLLYKAEAEAWEILKTQIKDTWFIKHVLTMFSVSKSVPREEFVNSLGQAVALATKDESTIRSLERLTEILTTVGIIRVDENTGVVTLGTPPREKLEAIEVPAGVHLIQVLIGNERYAVDVKELEAFVKEKGKKLDSKEYKIA